MKKIFLQLLLLICCQLNAQNDIVSKTISVFPYQQVTEAAASLQQMQAWNKAEWNALLLMLEDDSLKVKANFAVNAYTHSIAGDKALNTKTAGLLSNGLLVVKSYAAKELIIKELGLLGNDVAVATLSKLLKEETLADNAARALATIRSTSSIGALKAALAKNPGNKNVQAALDYINQPQPVTVIKQSTPSANKSQVQQLLDLQDQLEVASNPLIKKTLLAQVARINGFSAFMLASKYLNDADVADDAALVTARLALSDNTIRGGVVREVLSKSLSLIKGEDSAMLVSKLARHLKAMPFDNGFVSLFNEKDLTGWKALVGNPIARAKMSATALQQAQDSANEKAKGTWVVKDGVLAFTGHGDNLCTEKKYGDVEMFVDWKITPQGDAGIYLRGTPQVQIWDTSRRNVGAQVGSGGLYNNSVNPRNPLVVADNAVGQWNRFHIIMKGEKVTVYLNGQLVTDNVVLENYWDRKLPIFSKEQIELQAHGTYVAYRNIYVREIPETYTTTLSDEEKQQGYALLYDGTDLNQWMGNTTGYVSEEGAIVVHPELAGGNLYTKEEFADFSYRFEFQLTPGANNGIGIRAPLEGDAAYAGMEIQVLDSEHPIYQNLQVYQYHGSVYGVIPAKRGFLKPTGEWNQEEIIAKGNKIKVILNGETIVDGDIKQASKNGTIDHNNHPGLLRTSGHIGFLGHGDVVRFKNIRVKRL